VTSEDSCALDAAPVRAAPAHTAEQVTEALRGEPLHVEERRQGWARVRTAYGYPGWIEEEALAGAPGSSWPPGPSGRSPLDEAREYLGAPYRWGGMTRQGIDCSGLVHMSYRRAGRTIPRDADEQEAAGAVIREDALEPGDLVTYGTDSADHIAFWLGAGRILHATGRPGVEGVVEEPEPPDLRARRRRTIRFEDP
jgi:cell wall-associated NlpC family hydrolase